MGRERSKCDARNEASCAVSIILRPWGLITTLAEDGTQRIALRRTDRLFPKLLPICFRNSNWEQTAAGHFK